MAPRPGRHHLGHDRANRVLVARLNKNRRRAVQDEIPPVKCSSRARTRGGAPCERYAMVGTTVCHI